MKNKGQVFAIPIGAVIVVAILLLLLVFGGGIAFILSFFAKINFVVITLALGIFIMSFLNATGKFGKPLIPQVNIIIMIITGLVVLIPVLGQSIGGLF